MAINDGDTAATNRWHNTFGFDPDALRAKYKTERDKRLRPDGENQYLELAGKFARYADEDPYAPAGYTREPITLDAQVVVVGGGFSGMLAAVRLREQGFKDVRIIEAGADFGGTWYWNRYPGAQCDIESYCYLPLLEELQVLPKEKYSFAPEIFEHSQRIGRTFDLYDTAIFQTRVREMRWDAASSRWNIETNWNDRITAQFVIMATGPASRPKLIDIPGIDDFQGHTFHTSRWDYEYTGGGHWGDLNKLGEKRVAIIGTGATAIQCVPHLAAHAKQLYVFQRTPSSVDIRGNKPTDPEWAKTLKPGWQRERRENFNAILTGQPFEEDLVNDAWTSIFRKLAGTVPGSTAPDIGERMEIADFQKMNEIRERVDATVEDRTTADALKPWYRQFCKRPTFNDDYLAAFNRPNVTLIDVSASRGVEKITTHGVVANGREYDVDCIIFATGFEIGTSVRRRVDFDVIGADGASLFDHWAQGLRTLHGHSAHGFPNWFFVGIGQNGLSVNMTSMFDDQARHVAYILRQAIERGASTIEPTAEAEADWVAEIRRLSVSNREFMEACTPGYYNGEGKFEETGTLVSESYAPGINAFNDVLERWRSDGKLAGLELKS